MVVPNYSTIKEILRPEGLEKAAYWRRFAMLLTLSVVISTMGLLRDSGAVVIAAMLVAPLMTPILGIAAAIVMGWSQRAARLLFIVLVAAFASVLLAWALVFVAGIPKDVVLPRQVVARTDPGIEDLVVALAAGVAGAYVQIRKSEISLLPGAAIGVALVPPLSASGILAYFGHFQESYEATLLFLTNLGAIVLSASAVYLITAARSALRPGRQRLTRFSAGLVINLVVLAVVVVQLGNATYQRYEAVRAETRIAARIHDWAAPTSIEILRVQVRPSRMHADIWVIIDVPVAFASDAIALDAMLPDHLEDRSIMDELTEELGAGYEVTMRFQTRFAGKRILGTNVVQPATAPQNTDTDD